MKKFLRAVFNFSLICLIIKELDKAIRAVKEYIKTRREVEAKRRELEILQAEVRFEEMRRGIEEGKEHDTFMEELRKPVELANQLDLLNE